MPELPEVETVCRALAPTLTGRTINKVELFRPTLRRPLSPLAVDLPGHRILEVTRRARYIVATLDAPFALVIHLGMTGILRIEPPSIPHRKHEHLFLHLDNGLLLRFEDTRRFGSFDLLPMGADGMPEWFHSFGPEPFSDAFTPQYLHTRSRGLSCPVKCFLMDNAVVAGIGNIYATEILFAARISPLLKAGKLTLAQCHRLVEQAHRILEEAINQGGTTIADFRHVDGSEGEYALSLQIYGKSGQPCPICGTQLQCVKLGGRTSSFCPHCQPRPRQ